jgi:hypothetical protein
VCVVDSGLCANTKGPGADEGVVMTRMRLLSSLLLILIVVYALTDKGVAPHTHIVAGEIHIWSYLRVKRMNNVVIDAFAYRILQPGDVLVMSDGSKIDYDKESDVIVNGEPINECTNVFIEKDGRVERHRFIPKFR